MWCIKSDFINTYFHFYSPFTITSIFSYLCYENFQYDFKTTELFSHIDGVIESFFIYYVNIQSFYFTFNFSLLFSIINLKYTLQLTFLPQQINSNYKQHYLC